MPRTTLALTIFVSGELGAKLDGRTDFNKYATGAKTPLREGRITKPSAEPFKTPLEG